MNRLAISFSGGRSSAVMLKTCLERFASSHEILITFCNTGCEHEDTLRFVNDVDKRWAAGRVEWIEAVINGPGVGPTARRVTYETASRNGEPFEAFIAKHGIPCRTHPQCTSRLKEEPMLWWRKQHGWNPGTYDTAIGIRADEVDRMSAKAKEKRLIYPLVRDGWTKDSVRSYMQQFDWDLRLPSEAYGNCKWCWKKSDRKLMTLAIEDVSVFDFPREMERKYPESGRKFFRGRRTVGDIVAAANSMQFTHYRDSLLAVDELDVGGGCGESCEIGAD